MYRAFTDSEFLRGSPDRSPVLYNVKSQALCPLLYIFLQTPSLPASNCSILCGPQRNYNEASLQQGVSAKSSNSKAGFQYIFLFYIKILLPRCPKPCFYPFPYTPANHACKKGFVSPWWRNEPLFDHPSDSAALAGRPLPII